MEIKKRLDEWHEGCERWNTQLQEWHTQLQEWNTQLQEWQKSLETRETNLIGRLLEEEEKLKQGGVNEHTSTYSFVAKR